MLKIPKKTFIRLIVELIATAVLYIILLRVYRFWDAATKRGFFCGDESLMYPYHEDTISSKSLYQLSVGIPVTIIVVGEMIKMFAFKRKHMANKYGLWRFILNFLDILIPYVFAMAAEHLISTVTKLTVGRLRPHFFDVCRPIRMDNTTCSDPKNHGIYIEDYLCCPHTPNVTSFMRINVHLSFPSGHSSLIFCAMIFTVLYLQRFSKSLYQFKWNLGLLLPLLQMLCVLLATFVAVSRVKDYKHHWSDVLAGMLLGSSIAITVSFYVQQQQMRVEKFLEAKLSDTKTTTDPNTSLSFVTSTPNKNCILVP